MAPCPQAPHLLFKYLRLHAPDGTAAQPPTDVEVLHGSVGRLARCWLLAVIGLGATSLHELRCVHGANGAAFDAMAARSPRAARAVELWRAADARDARVQRSPRGRTAGDDVASNDVTGGNEVAAEVAMGASEGADDRTDDEVALPGASDPESLFMMGEEVRVTSPLH